MCELIWLEGIFKGAEYLLLKNRATIRRPKVSRRMEELLSLNRVINAVLILKDELKHVFFY